MRTFLVLMLVFLVTSCTRITKVNTEFNIPDLDSSDFYDSSYKMGWESLKQGDPDKAIEYFQQSNLNDDKLFTGFGYSYLAKRKYNLARQNFQRALSANPDNFRAEMGMATMYEQINDNENAFRIYSGLMAKIPENAWVKVRYEYIKSTETENYLKQAEHYKSMQNHVQYVKSLEKALEFSREIIDLKIDIGDHYYEMGDYAKARVNFEKVIEKQPNREDILFKLGTCYENTGKLDSALLIFNRLAELKPGDIDITNKINDLKIKFYNLDLPEKFKNIFFKDVADREDLAALIGHYFSDYLTLSGTPEIITDIIGSYATEQIIKVCTLGIMKLRPDHSFGRFVKLDRASLGSGPLRITGLSAEQLQPENGL